MEIKKHSQMKSYKITTKYEEEQEEDNKKSIYEQFMDDEGDIDIEGLYEEIKDNFKSTYCFNDVELMIRFNASEYYTEINNKEIWNQSLKDPITGKFLLLFKDLSDINEHNKRFRKFVYDFRKIYVNISNKKYPSSKENLNKIRKYLCEDLHYYVDNNQIKLTEDGEIKCKDIFVSKKIHHTFLDYKQNCKATAEYNSLLENVGIKIKIRTSNSDLLLNAYPRENFGIVKAICKDKIDKEKKKKELEDLKYQKAIEKLNNPTKPRLSIKNTPNKKNINEEYKEYYNNISKTITKLGKLKTKSKTVIINEGIKYFKRSLEIIENIDKTDDKTKLINICKLIVIYISYEHYENTENLDCIELFKQNYNIFEQHIDVDILNEENFDCFISNLTGDVDNDLMRKMYDLMDKQEFPIVIKPIKKKEESNVEEKAVKKSLIILTNEDYKNLDKIIENLKEEFKSEDIQNEFGIQRYERLNNKLEVINKTTLEKRSYPHKISSLCYLLIINDLVKYSKIENRGGLYERCKDFVNLYFQSISSDSVKELNKEVIDKFIDNFVSSEYEPETFVDDKILEIIDKLISEIKFPIEYSSILGGIGDEKLNKAYEKEIFDNREEKLIQRNIAKAKLVEEEINNENSPTKKINKRLNVIKSPQKEEKLPIIENNKIDEK